MQIVEGIPTRSWYKVSLGGVVEVITLGHNEDGAILNGLLFCEENPFLLHLDLPLAFEYGAKPLDDGEANHFDRRQEIFPQFAAFFVSSANNGWEISDSRPEYSPPISDDQLALFNIPVTPQKGTKITFPPAI